MLKKMLVFIFLFIGAGELVAMNGSSDPFPESSFRQGFRDIECVRFDNPLVRRRVHINRKLDVCSEWFFTMVKIKALKLGVITRYDYVCAEAIPKICERIVELSGDRTLLDSLKLYEESHSLLCNLGANGVSEPEQIDLEYNSFLESNKPTTVRSDVSLFFRRQRSSNY